MNASTQNHILSYENFLKNNEMKIHIETLKNCLIYAKKSGKNVFWQDYNDRLEFCLINDKTKIYHNEFSFSHNYNKICQGSIYYYAWLTIEMHEIENLINNICLRIQKL